MQRPAPLVVFALASLFPAVLLGLGLIWGGLWAWAGLVYISAFAAVMDHLPALFFGDAAHEAEFPATPGLLILLAAGQLVLMPLLVLGIAESPWSAVGLFMGTSLWLGQIGNPTAHELIHRGQRGLMWLGMLMLSSLLFGHHVSAHRLVHHRFVASPQDPNTARSGEGFYRFFLRAWIGSFRAGFRAEAALRAGRGGLHPYVIYGMISLGVLGGIFALGGARALVVWAVLCLSAQGQLLLSDYVQHYGLLRGRDQMGRLDPVAARHSWDAPFWFSSAMMLNAPRHGDHHIHPARAFPALQSGQGPMLPWPLPLACTIALVPPLWKAKIRPHLRPWL